MIFRCSEMVAFTFRLACPLPPGVQRRSEDSSRYPALFSVPNVGPVLILQQRDEYYLDRRTRIYVLIGRHLFSGFLSAELYQRPWTVAASQLALTGFFPRRNRSVLSSPLFSPDFLIAE